LAQRQRRSGRTGTAQRGQGHARDNDGILPVLARAVREVENRVQRGPMERTKFQVTALLAAEERARVRADASVTDAQRDVQLRRCFRKVSSQPRRLRFLPDRCVRSVRRAEKCAWVPCAGHASSGMFAKSFDGGSGRRGAQ
jgi:hypothetical protein